jgi:hypothetical protein
VASSLFCFERDPHGLSHPFQTAKVLLREDKVRMLQSPPTLVGGSDGPIID